MQVPAEASVTSAPGLNLQRGADVFSTAFFLNLYLFVLFDFDLSQQERGKTK